jgi:hypothetical protein
MVTVKAVENKAFDKYGLANAGMGMFLIKKGSGFEYGFGKAHEFASVEEASKVAETVAKKTPDFYKRYRIVLIGP